MRETDINITDRVDTTVRLLDGLRAERARKITDFDL